MQPFRVRTACDLIVRRGSGLNLQILILCLQMRGPRSPGIIIINGRTDDDGQLHRASDYLLSSSGVRLYYSEWDS